MEHLQTSLFPQSTGRQPQRGQRLPPRAPRLEPMIATTGELPADQWRYGFELKWNGTRALVHLDNGCVQVQTGRQLDVSSRFPELLPLGEMAASRRLILDGMIVTPGVGGRPDSQSLAERALLTDQGCLWQAIELYPITFIAFDLLHLDGRDTTTLPYHHRRELLERLELVGPNWDTPPYLEEEGSALIEACRQRRLDGVIAKRIDSIYEPGRRTRAWVDIRVRPRQPFVVCGMLPRLDASSPLELLLGVYDRTREQAAGAPQHLHYAGLLSISPNHVERERLENEFRGLQRPGSPFTDLGAYPGSDPIFFEPVVTCDVEFAQWTSLGTVKHATFKGLGNSSTIDPRDVVRES